MSLLYGERAFRSGFVLSFAFVPSNSQHLHSEVGAIGQGAINRVLTNKKVNHMASQKQLDLLSSGKVLWDKWRRVYSDVQAIEPDLHEADLHGADLYKADLHGADLTGANLQGADLRGADLREADLRNANLRSANLSDANLLKARLHWADLRDANLCRTNLKEADLSNADLRGADLEGAELYRADFRGSVRTEVETRV